LQSQAEPWNFNLPVREGDTPVDPLLVSLLSAFASKSFLRPAACWTALPGATDALLFFDNLGGEKVLRRRLEGGS